MEENNEYSSPFKVYSLKEVPIVENLLEYCRKSDGSTKGKNRNTIFAEKLILENGKAAAPVLTEPVQLILLISGDFRM